MDDVLVSIIVPVYNVEKYLSKCIESIISQTHKKIEIILINDGSTDSSLDICNKYAEKDNRINVINNANHGVSYSRNNGIDVSLGEYICFIDSDDWIDDCFIEEMLKTIKTTNTKFVIAPNTINIKKIKVQKNKNIDIWNSEKTISEFLYPRIPIGCWNKIYEKNFLIKNKIRFLPQFFMGEGLNFIIEVARIAEKIGVCYKQMYFYNQENMESAMTKDNLDKRINALEALDNIEKSVDLNNKQIKIALKYHIWVTTFLALRFAFISGDEKLKKKYINIIKDKKSIFCILLANVKLKSKLITLFKYICPQSMAKFINYVKAK